MLATAATWSAITAIATAILALGVPVAIGTFLYTRRSDRAARARDDERRLDAGRQEVCLKVLQSQHALVRASDTARKNGTAVDALHIDEFETALFRFYVMAPNALAKVAQHLWAMSRAYAEGSSIDHDLRRECDEARDAFLEKCREQFGLGVLFVTGEEALRRVETRLR